MKLSLQVLTLLLLAGGELAAIAADVPVNYSRDIRPILAKNCIACHGPDEGTREAGLRLDERSAALAELDSGNRAIVEKSPARSELLSRVESTDEFVQMPPPDSGKKLSDEEKQLLRRWVQEGAPYSDHWSFRPIQDSLLPPTSNRQWPRQGLDFFILFRLEEEQLSPAPEADRRTLMRRLSLDLLGLSPEPEEVEEFVNDPRPDAYEQLVDRLLASPHFGERWGRHWLDLARYADSNGYLGDELRPDAYRYRDWVIGAVNADLPFDEFTIEQIAGDLLPDATEQQKIATGFHRNSMKNTEAGVDREADRVIRTVDRLSTVGTAWLGLTIGCAECHTHKYDPLTHREFYQLYAFFNNLDDVDLKIGERPAAAEDPKVRAEREGKLEQIALQLAKLMDVGETDDASPFQNALRTLSQPAATRSEADKEALDHWRAELSKPARTLAKAYEKLAQSRPGPTNITAATVRQSRHLRETHIHHRGDFRQPKEKVFPGTPEFLPPLLPRGTTADRLDLARWLVDDEQPLTARATVNHFWKHLFGKGLVETEENLGTAGSEPSHPELLDWLATRLIESGWSRKSVIRLIVTSATYRQSSRLTEELALRDPQNRLLARQSRFRLEGEIIRDVALTAGGLLSEAIGGPAIRPPLTSRITEVSRNQDWKVSTGSEKYRRGLYILFRRATPYPMLTTFDVPDSTTACADRERSNSPLQALTLLNDPVFFECAQQLGRELTLIEGDDADQWLAQAVRRTLSRPPTAPEFARLKALHAEQLRLLRRSSTEDLRQIIGGEPVHDRLQEHAARVLIARSLMNLDEFITRE